MAIKRKTRREFIKQFGLGISALTIPQITSIHSNRRDREAKKKPNLLFVFGDQFRKQSMGFMNEDPVITPNFDKFAKQGVTFTNAVSSCPICSPFRAMLMTGRFPLSTNMASNCMPGTDLELSEEEVCFGDILKDSGYTTGFIGKWHLEIPSRNKSTKPPDDPKNEWDGWTPPGLRRHGFDFWYAYNCNGSHFNPNYWKDSQERIDINQWSVEHETDVAIEFIKNKPQDKPFALFLAWNPPHPPFVAPEKYKALYKNKDLPIRPTVKVSSKYHESYLPYLAAVSSCDDNFGKLMNALEELRLSDNTILVFTSDHGEMMGFHDRFAKSIWYEESIGIPFMIRWPGHIKPRFENMPFACYNFMPTLLGLMDLSIPETVEGMDYSKLLLGEHEKKASSAIIASYGNPGNLLAVGQKPSIWALNAENLRKKGIDWRTVGYRGLRTERYTYVVNKGPEGKQLIRYLYDNQKDPYQLNPIESIYAQENDLMLNLNQELQRWLDKMNNPFLL